MPTVEENPKKMGGKKHGQFNRGPFMVGKKHGKKHGKNRRMQNVVVILRDFPYNSAVFGLVI